MPNGQTHRRITVWAGLLSSLPALYFLGVEAAYFELGVALTIWVNPDLDIHNHLGSVGDMIGFDDYRDLIPHRAGLRSDYWWKVSRLIYASHIPLAGTLGRFMILLLPALCLAAITSSLSYFSMWGLFLVFLGMSWSDLWHVLADMLASGFRSDRMELANKAVGERGKTRRGKRRINHRG